jgi:4-diphosphocytidyl-2-C-methyl-D-erythritol kinase
VGERITKLKSFGGHVVVLVKPPFGVSTKDAYGAFNLEKIKRHVETEKLIDSLAKDDLNGVHYYSRNLLENVVIQSYTVIKSIKQRVVKTGARVTLMSGSGPTVYGIYENKETAVRALDELRKNGNEVILTETI